MRKISKFKLEVDNVNTLEIENDGLLDVIEENGSIFLYGITNDIEDTEEPDTSTKRKRHYNIKLLKVDEQIDKMEGYNSLNHIVINGEIYFTFYKKNR